MSGNSLRFAEKLANAPWLCDASYVEFMHGLVLRHAERAASGEKLDREAVEQAVGRPLENTRQVTIRDGVARIPVEGPIFRRANLFTEISGGVSTAVLARDFLSAYNDATVHSILFVFDSPGGEATGINELAGIIREKRDEGIKRIEAYCDGMCASAAYWLASATARITADATAAVGSIGVVTRVRNPQDAGKTGTLEFWNSRSPKKRIDPKSYEGQAAIQGYVDDLGDEFISAVAVNRGVSEEEVVKDFGEGFVMTGRRAVAVGLADALGSEEEAMERLRNRTPGEPLRVAAAGTEVGVAGTQEPGIAPAAEDERSARGILARIGDLLTGTAVDVAAGDVEGSTTPPDTENTDEGRSVRLEERDGRTVLVSDAGEELELSAEDRDRLAGGRNAEVAAENARLREELQAARGQSATATVDAELGGFLANGAPPYMIELARPVLLGAATGEASPADAERWRTALRGAAGSVEMGERGLAGGESQGALDDHEKVMAVIKERGLDEKADYAKVAGELAARGEIRRSQNTDQEGE